MQDGSALLNFEKQWISNWEEQIEERKINDRKLRMYKVHNNEQRTNCIFFISKEFWIVLSWKCLRNWVISIVSIYKPGKYDDILNKS